MVEVNTEFQKLKEGDIITFLQSGEMVTHEIIEVNDNGTVTTRGLATEISDHPVDASNYVGRVVLVLPGLSGFLSMSHGALRKTIWIILFGVILFGPELISKVYDLIYEKRK